MANEMKTRYGRTVRPTLKAMEAKEAEEAMRLAMQVPLPQSSADSHHSSHHPSLALRKAELRLQQHEKQAQFEEDKKRMELDMIRLENNQKLSQLRFEIDCKEMDNISSVASEKPISKKPTLNLGDCAVDTATDTCNKVLRWISENENACTSQSKVEMAKGLLNTQGLPKLHVKTFNGNSEEWPEFILNFKSLIDDNSSLTNAHKLAYLKTFLGKRPTDSVFGLLLHAENYGKALSELERIYGNSALVIEAYIERVRTFPPLKDNSGLLALKSEVAQLVHMFRTMGYETDLKAKGLYTDLKSKLPLNMRESWGRYVVKKGGDPNVEMFHQWLVEKEEALRIGGGLPPVCSNPPKPKPSVNPHPPHSFRTANSMSNSRPSTLFASNNARPYKKCPFCTQEHWLSDCPTFLGKTPKERFLWCRGDGRCFLCIKRSHTSRECQARFRCQKCDRKHSTVLHDSFVPSDTENQSGNRNAVLTAATSAFATVYLQTLPVRLHTPNGRVVDTCAILDSGSQATLINSSFARDLGLNGPRINLTVGNIKENEETQVSKRVNFWLSNPNDPFMTPIKVRDAVTYSSPFNLPKQHLPRDSEGRVEWEHLRDLELPDIDAGQIQILVGANTKRALTQLELREGPDQTPNAIRTPLGWSLMGGSSVVETRAVNVNIVNLNSQADELTEQLQKFWSTESFGTTQSFDDEKPYSMQDRKALQCLDSSVKLHEDGQYEVGMLWAEEQVNLPNNKVMAERRFEQLEKRLRRDPDLCSRYCKSLNDYIEKGYAKKMTQEQVETTSSRTYYLPHQAVINPKKPEKLRVVFDAAAKFRNRSLNDALVTGPDLVNSLVGVLMRFRCGAVTISADIESMFSRIRLPANDQDALRFFWKPDMTSPESALESPKVYQNRVHIFGAKCSPACANYCLKRVATDMKDGADCFSAEALDTIQRSFYVDDLLKGIDTTERAVSLSTELVNLCDKGGFKLTKWASNCPEVLAAVTKQPGISTVIDLDLDNKSVTRTLGIACDMKLDVFIFRTIPVDKPRTKRGILSTVSSVFDPLGFVAPYVIRAKVILQDLWVKGVGWDDPLEQNDVTDWFDWVQDLSELSSVVVPRGLWPAEFVPAQNELHTFVDASEKAFAANCYLTVTSTSGERHSALVIAKARVAPLNDKCLTLPRLELQAAVLGVRLQQTVKRELDLDFSAVHFWSDSLIVLQYIKNDTKRFKTFVANRISEIRQSSDPDQWHYVPSALNPADDATRGLPVGVLSSDHRWFTGPAFLRDAEHMWPSQALLNSTVLSECDTEVKYVNVVKEEPSFISPIDYSDLRHLLRVCAWCVRFLSNARVSLIQKREIGPLKVKEIKDMLEYWVGDAQAQAYPEEVKALSTNGVVPRHSHLVKLLPVYSNGLLRVGGRLDNMDLPYESRHQLILPRQSAIAKLVVKDAHVKVLHSGVEHTITKVRSDYWIPRVRVLVKTVIRECRYCIWLFSQPKVPRIAQLPSARVTSFKAVFHATGVDYFGPMFIKRGRCLEKRWGCLFTCLSVRAVHLEIVPSLETDDFILALRRFVARRGPPVEMFSDNGTNFVGANRELREALKAIDQEKVHDVLASKGIQWHFNPGRTPHFSGVIEILVKSVKRALRTVLKNQCVHEPVLHTLMCEVESVVNSRPLTHVGVENPVSEPEPLTPNHFLLHRSVVVSSPIDTASEDSLTRKRWRLTQLLTDQFWRRWRREYLPSLTVASKWTVEAANLKPDDVVLLVNRNAPRGQWPLGRVVEVFPGRDGRVRVVQVKTANGVYRRGASEICLLEEA